MADAPNVIWSKKVGKVTAEITERGYNGKIYRDVELFRAYQKDGEWKKAWRLSVEDIEDVKLLLELAERFLRTGEKSPAASGPAQDVDFNDDDIPF